MTSLFHRFRTVSRGAERLTWGPLCRQFRCASCVETASARPRFRNHPLRFDSVARELLKYQWLRRGSPW
jgi:hypothetical protein